MLPALAARLLFYPTVTWNLLLNRLSGHRRWYDRIDQHLVVGALPFAAHLEELRAAGVRGVINTCAEYAGPEAEYRRLGIAHLRVPTVDFTSPTHEHVLRSLEFIREHAARDETVYVHCKAGRGRSATIALCWLVAERGMSPEEGQRLLLEKRPHVHPTLHLRAVVRAVHEAAVRRREERESGS